MPYPPKHIFNTQNSSHYVGEIHHDPYTGERQQWMKDDVGNWYLVPCEDNDWRGVKGEDGSDGSEGMDGQGGSLGYNSNVCNMGGYSSSSIGYGTSGCAVVGNAYVTPLGYGASMVSNYKPLVIDSSYTNDLKSYQQELYRQELEISGLMGIGINQFGIKPSVNRDDTEICDRILNNFNDMKDIINRDMIMDGGGTYKKPSKFEKRLYAALQRKEEIENKKAELLKKMKKKQSTAKKTFDQRIADLKKKIPKSDDKDIVSMMEKLKTFENNMKQERNHIYGSEETFVPDSLSNNINPIPAPMSEKDILLSNLMGKQPKQKKPELTPEELVAKQQQDAYDYFIRTKLDLGVVGSTVYQYPGKEIDGLEYIDFEFVPSIDENDSQLDIYIQLKGRVIDSQEKYADHTVEYLINSDDFPSRLVGKMYSIIKGEKKTFIKKVRIMKNVIWEHVNGEDKQETV